MDFQISIRVSINGSLDEVKPLRVLACFIAILSVPSEHSSKKKMWLF